ncbi:alpha/beta hydrolase [Paracoccus sp. TK19116]|uniref:Alpha/beta hydrolase n=1 Tax=Paracoccus albicereus TaxID=2922394 RepID=A0ABT1MTJ9_9RHOB|nr:alpha/beta hydrolase [Paracoccus albicereus]MCQ0971653.1 alpha/beta hydrolase [Paracoccus albicereus]
MQDAPFHQLPGDPLPAATAYWARAEDGVRLRLAVWRDGAAADDRAAGTVLLFPGRTEYIEKYAPTAAWLNERGYAVIAIDWRGQGLSDRLQDDPRPGHVGAFADYQRDVVEMVVAASDLGLPRPWHLLAHSMGGCIGLGALLDDLPVESAVFSAPMWGINLRQMPQRMALGVSYLAGRMGRGGRAAPSSGGGKGGTYVLDESFSANLLTGDAQEWSRMVIEAASWPDLTIGGASFDWVAHALNECSRLSREPSPSVPTLVALGALEQVVSKAAIRERVSNWSGAHLLDLPDCRHEPMMETPSVREAFLNAMLDHFEG